MGYALNKDEDFLGHFILHSNMWLKLGGMSSDDFDKNGVTKGVTDSGGILKDMLNFLTDDEFPSSDHIRNAFYKKISDSINDLDIKAYVRNDNVTLVCLSQGLFFVKNDGKPLAVLDIMSIDTDNHSLHLGALCDNAKDFDADMKDVLNNHDGLRKMLTYAMTKATHYTSDGDVDGTKMN